MLLNRNTAISYLVGVDETPPIRYAAAALRRDMAAVFAKTDAPGGSILLEKRGGLPTECYLLEEADGALRIGAGDDLGFAYGLYEVSRRFLGVLPFWFWNDQRFAPRGGEEVPEGFVYRSAPARVRWRGWFVNDETLLMHWSWQRRAEGPWEMVFEALLRCGGNLVIPGTDSDARCYRRLAAEMGLVITHHHAEPLGAEMFARAYPGLEPSFAKYPELFRGLWRDSIRAHRGMRVIWNIGFRGQGDRPFWDDDPAYDTPEKRGALMSALIREQYDLVKAADPGALCCTNLYGETMELYKQGLLELPADVIRIWADNGFGKMVSRRQLNANPRIPALPSEGDGGAHGLYYHASFYDLQAASHITALPNAAEFVRGELAQALKRGVDDYWLVNCSNVKPHTCLLDFIALLWREGSADPAAHRAAYAAAYYGEAHADLVAACIKGYTDAAVLYGPHEDDHAGDQFYNHVPRMLISRYITGCAGASEELRWLSDAPTLAGQNAAAEAVFAEAVPRYEDYLRQCEGACAALAGAPRVLFADSILLQARLYALWSQASLDVCRAIDAGQAGDYERGFYLAGRARQGYLAAYEAMRAREHGRWIDFYAGECQTDIRQSAQLAAYLMSFLRNLGEGPHFYAWQRKYFDSEADRRVMLMLNTAPHPTDDALWRVMEQALGE